MIEDQFASDLPSLGEPKVEARPAGRLKMTFPVNPAPRHWQLIPANGQGKSGPLDFVMSDPAYHPETGEIVWDIPEAQLEEAVRFVRSCIGPSNDRYGQYLTQQQLGRERVQAEVDDNAQREKEAHERLRRMGDA